jgi:hypothetical protein
VRPALVVVTSLAQLAITAAVVWYLHGLTDPLLSGWPHTLAVILLAIPTWLLINWLLTSTGVLPAAE